MADHMVHDPVLATVDRLVAALGAHGPLPLDGVLLEDAESRRGCALLAESELAAESHPRLLRDRARLFVGEGGRPPIAPLAAPPARAESLAQLRAAMAAGGLDVPPHAADLVDVLRMLAALGPTRADEPSSHAPWRHQLLRDHLLAWGVRCLSRMQLGAQTFFYQGVAALGLGLLRHLADDEPRWSSAAS